VSVEDVSVEDVVTDVAEAAVVVEESAPAAPKLDVLAAFADLQASPGSDGTVETLELTPVPADLFETAADDETDVADEPESADEPDVAVADEQEPEQT